MSLAGDVTIGEGESIPPNTSFTKTWRLQNTGEQMSIVACDNLLVNARYFEDQGTFEILSL